MITENIRIRNATTKFRSEIIALLDILKLPVADLSVDLSHFYIATDKDRVAGVAGLEIHGTYGLLRSVAVHPEYRNQKIAEQLIRRLEEEARDLKLSAIYLLTETASGYFVVKGYNAIHRNEVPIVLQQSSEFSHVCPASAIVMKKTLMHADRAFQ